MNILVVAAHPDDEVLGCGGAVARYSHEGHKVFVAILGEGITSRYLCPEEADKGLVETLRGNSRQAADLLGVEKLFSFNLPDNRFDTVPLVDVVKIIESVISQMEPQIVFTHHAGDLNLDHVITNRATLIATRPCSGSCVKDLYAFEVPSSTEWMFTREHAFRPNVFIDIGTTLERKIQAMRLYESEARPFPHPRSPQALRAIAQRWGSVAGLDAAEAFELVRLVR